MDSFVAPKKRVPTKLQTPLAHNFGFDYGDLQDNRAGFISHWQKKRLRWYLLSYTVSVLIWVAILAFLPLAMIFSSGELTPVPTLWAGTVFVLFGLFWLWQIRSVYLDLRRGKVAELIAEVAHVRKATPRKERRGGDVYERNDMDYYVLIGYEKFSTTRQQMQAFREGILYHIYIAPESRQILSASPVTQDEKHDPSIAFLYEKRKSNGEYTLMDDDKDIISNKGKR